MFDQLSERLSGVVQNLRGRGRLDEDNIKDALRQVRMALLEADVALPVVKQFIEKTRERAVGAEVEKSLSPGQAFIKIVHNEVQALLGTETESLNLKAQAPVVILMVGLQGAGKTTTTGKLAQHLISRQQKKVGVVSVDVQRPAARAQLAQLAKQTQATLCAAEDHDDPLKLVSIAINEAKQQNLDVLLVDTAGRLHIDENLMSEVQQIHGLAHPTETLFVIDSMMGQDALKAAQAFHQTLALTGVILTKVDGDARGGAAMSVRSETGVPIKFMGVGEHMDALEIFHPERIASRILGMGDVLSLIEEVEEKVDAKKAQKLAKKVAKGRGFDFSDLRDQLKQMEKLGGMASLMAKIPGAAKLAPAMQDGAAEAKMKEALSLIDSMTPHERRFPKLISGSRKKRIAAGAGRDLPAVNRLLKQHKQMEKMMKKMKRGGMAKMMNNLR